ncbi:MAG: hypothetical protein U9N76_01945 [Candidatus Marinimicrobia bacterium]|nr:hypothetical protein [Candidatus Neomarinimicrobiota bacterium]
MVIEKIRINKTTMKIKALSKKQNSEFTKKITNKYNEFEKLIIELNKKEIPLEIVNSINKEIDEIDSFSGSDKSLLKYMRKVQHNILKLIKKKIKLVTKNHYRNIGIAIGVSVFGVSLGVVFGASIGNTSLIAITIPIGMAIGLAIGTSMDKKAFEDGKQLDLEIRY